MASARRPRLLSPIALARRNAIYKGVLGGDRKWLALGGVVWGARFVKKAFGRTEEVVTVEKLEPGQWMSLRAIAPPTRREKKAARAAQRAAKS